MSTQPMPACEALAADPARFLFKLHLGRLVSSSSYQLKRDEAIRLSGYLSGLLEAQLITDSQLEAVSAEIDAFTWGTDQ